MNEKEKREACTELLKPICVTLTDMVEKGVIHGFTVGISSNESSAVGFRSVDKHLAASMIHVLKNLVETIIDTEERKN